MRSIARRIESGRASSGQRNKKKDREGRRERERMERSRSERQGGERGRGRGLERETLRREKRREGDESERERKESRREKEREGRRACTAVVNGNNCCGRCHSKARVPNARCQTVVRVITVITLYRDTRCVPADRSTLSSAHLLPLCKRHPILPFFRRDVLAVVLLVAVLVVAAVAWHSRRQLFPSSLGATGRTQTRTKAASRGLTILRLPVRTDNGRLAPR